MAYFLFEMRLNFWTSCDALLYALKLHLMQILAIFKFFGVFLVFLICKQCTKPVFQLDTAALCFEKKGLTK